MNTNTIGIPNIWAQYMNNKDCSQGLCSFYCPQWCYPIFPPPPSLPLNDFPVDENKFSPLVITIIGLLVGALLLVSYYAIISMYCTKRFPSSTNRDRNNVAVELGQVHPSLQEPWFVASNGLDEAVIMSIAMFEYKRGDGLVEGTECSVCLSEFVEEEWLRLLPKCSHAFHVQCIDTWLRRHSNCPLCRANVAGLAPTAGEQQQQQGHVEMEVSGEEENGEIEDVIEDEFGEMNLRRCLSMDSISRPGSSIVDVVCVSVETDRLEECEREVRHNNVMMKRSHSCGSWFFSKYGNTVIPF